MAAAPTLSARALADLARSGIDAKLAHKHGIVPVDTPLGRAADNYRIFYREKSGEINGFYRDKVFDNEGGKYKQPAKTKPRLYLPKGPDWTKIASDPAVALILAEGEKKAICGNEHGFPTIGIGGVWNWVSKGRVPIPDLDDFDWTGRILYLAYDSDTVRKPECRAAQDALAVEMQRRGAQVRIVDLPDDGTTKVGLDDFLVANKPAKLQALLNEAPEYEDPIAELNARHFAVMVGGKFLIGTEEHDPVFSAPDLQLSTPHDIRDLYTNRRVPVASGATVGLGELWLRDKRRREIKAIVFAPGEDTPDHYNLWRGFAVEPVKGDCSLYLDHIRQNICGGAKELAEWVTAWMADAVQNPATLPGTAIAARGGQGVGKGVWATEFGKLFGPHFLHLTNPKHLTGNFNAHTKNALVVFADEAFWAGDKSAEGTLKAMVTEKVRMLEMKGKDAFPIRNYTRLLIASNHSWVVPAAMDERRFLVLDVADTRQQDHDYFAAICDQMEGGGRAALMHYLLNVDTKRVNLREIPWTAALAETKLRSLSPAEAFIVGLLLDERGLWKSEVPTADLHQRYIESAKDAGERRRASSTELGMALKKLLPGVRNKRLWNNAARKQVRHYAFPPLAECRATVDAALKGPLDWDATDLAAKKGRRR